MNFNIRHKLETKEIELWGDDKFLVSWDETKATFTVPSWMASRMAEVGFDEGRDSMRQEIAKLFNKAPDELAAPSKRLQQLRASKVHELVAALRLACESIRGLREGCAEASVRDYPVDAWEELASEVRDLYAEYPRTPLKPEAGQPCAGAGWVVMVEGKLVWLGDEEAATRWKKAGVPVVSAENFASKRLPACPHGFTVVPEDLVTHMGDWRTACETAISLAESESVGHDVVYWRKQLDTLDRIEREMATADTVPRDSHADIQDWDDAALVHYVARSLKLERLVTAVIPLVRTQQQKLLNYGDKARAETSWLSSADELLLSKRVEGDED